MWKNVVERGRTQMTIWRMRIACLIPKATNKHTHTGFVIFIAFPMQQQLHKHASMLRYMYIACLVLNEMKEMFVQRYMNEDEALIERRIPGISGAIKSKFTNPFSDGRKDKHGSDTRL